MRLKIAWPFAATAGLLLVTTGCAGNTANTANQTGGAAYRAGQHVGNAAEDLGNAAGNAGRAVGEVGRGVGNAATDAANAAGGALNRLGRAGTDAVGGFRNGVGPGMGTNSNWPSPGTPHSQNGALGTGAYGGYAPGAYGAGLGGQTIQLNHMDKTVQVIVTQAMGRSVVPNAGQGRTLWGTSALAGNYGNYPMRLTVPLGWSVRVVVPHSAANNHSVAIVPYGTGSPALQGTTGAGGAMAGNFGRTVAGTPGPMAGGVFGTDATGTRVNGGFGAGADRSGRAAESVKVAPGGASYYANRTYPGTSIGQNRITQQGDTWRTVPGGANATMAGRNVPGMGASGAAQQTRLHATRLGTYAIVLRVPGRQDTVVDVIEVSNRTSVPTVEH